MVKAFTRDSEIRARQRTVLALALSLLAACSSGPVRVGPRPPANATLLGGARGSACGFLLLNLFPLGVNSRAESAYHAAQLAIGKRDVADARVTESFYSIPLLGTLLCTEIEETGVQ